MNVRAVPRQVALLDDGGASERYALTRRRGRLGVLRAVQRAGSEWTTSEVLVGEHRAPHLKGEDALRAVFDAAWLRRKTAPRRRSGRSLRIADVFSGCGQMSVGAAEAARAVGLRADLAVAVDLDADAVEVCRRTFDSCIGVTSPLQEHIDGELGAKMTSVERGFKRRVGSIDLLMGGPPCQGHSDLNNHTRRNDKRNGLALRMARMAEIFEPSHIVLENVRGIIHDRGGVFQRVREALENLGYRTAQRLLEAESYGVAQRRRRMFLVGTLAPGVDPSRALTLPRVEAPRTFDWACGDLETLKGDGPSSFDQAPTPTARSKARIAYLFENDAYELRNEKRPRCHRNGNHSYKSVYGRMFADQPSQTITTGFRCMGQGRYVHPRQPRTITPHEAARLQFIPDFVDFSGLRATSVAKLIGNAVPPKLTYGIVSGLLRSS